MRAMITGFLISKQKQFKSIMHKYEPKHFASHVFMLLLLAHVKKYFTWLRIRAYLLKISNKTTPIKVLIGIP